jgi:toxin ParE1/3/4
VTLWRVKLAAPAELDFANIVGSTVENFGAHQARVYRDTLAQAIGELRAGPKVIGSRTRDEIAPGLCTLHVARRGRRGRHFLMYRVASRSTIEIVRILHDSMDIRRHIAGGEKVGSMKDLMKWV